MSKNATIKRAKILVRKALISDIDRLLALTEKVYPQFPPYTSDALRGQINNFPEGQFVVEYWPENTTGEGATKSQLVGYCASVRLDHQEVFSPHRWNDISGSGFATTHKANGEYLYGIEVCVDPDFRGLKIGQRLYDARKKLCIHLRLKGIAFAGRIPGLSKKLKQYHTVENYVELVKMNKVRDAIMSFQMRNGFKMVGILSDYLPEDKDSLGNAVLMFWKNPQIEESTTKVEDPTKNPAARMLPTVRIASVQFQQRKVESFEEFKRNVMYFIEVAADYHSDFIVFPEFVTMPLLSIENKELEATIALEKLNEYTQTYLNCMHEAAIKYNINIIGGTHITKNKDGEFENICYVFLRDGSVHEQAKIHPTPSERYFWNIKGGTNLSVINTDSCPIGILVCYDSEFPELSRYLINQGAKILIVPFATDTKQGYLRVRYCCQARAIENQCYVVLSGNVGNLPSVHNMDINYAQSCILTPCDFPFAREGVAEDTTPNVEMIAFADLKLEDLVTARNSGTVQNLKDRRHDLYEVVWKKKGV